MESARLHGTRCAEIRITKIIGEIGGRGPGGREAVEGEMRGDGAIREQENYEKIITRSIATSPSSAPEY